MISQNNEMSYEQMHTMFQTCDEDHLKDFFLLVAERLEQPTHVTVDETINIILQAATRAGIDSYFILKYFQFTDEEIEEYFQQSNNMSEV
jgi:hypothetical protein